MFVHWSKNAGARAEISPNAPIRGFKWEKVGMELQLDIFPSRGRGTWEYRMSSRIIPGRRSAVRWNDDDGWLSLIK